MQQLELPGADPEIFERVGPEAIIYKILERGGPKSVKMAFECLFQSFSYKFFANTPPKGGGGGQASWAPPLNPPLGRFILFPQIILRNEMIFIVSAQLRGLLLRSKMPSKQTWNCLKINKCK